MQCRKIEKVISRCHSWNLEMLGQQISTERLWSCLDRQTGGRKRTVCGYWQMSSIPKELVGQLLMFKEPAGYSATTGARHYDKETGGQRTVSL